jgi:hypothetical protein
MRRHLQLALLVALVARRAPAQQSFDRDPDWEGFRNRLVPDKAKVTRQHFGYRPTNKAGGTKSGEIGGWVERSMTPAYYAKPIPAKTLNDHLTASGRFAVHRDESNTGTLIGWFNDKASRGWRTSDSLTLRIDGNGGKYWVFFEYGTSDWMTGGMGCFEGEAYQTTKTKPFAADGTPHDWSLLYDPAGAGTITLTLDGTEYHLTLGDGHKARGATFNRFGVFNQQTTGSGMEVYFDDLAVDGERFTFDEDPKWVGTGNDVEFQDRALRPLHDFGFSPTRFAGGRATGEIGGLVWRDERPAYYADRVGPLSLDDRLSASGKVAFTAAGSDSAVYVGWFDSASKRADVSGRTGYPQKNFLGVMVEGPSRIGHYFRPAYGCSDGEGAFPGDGPVIRPDGQAHDWSIGYDPAAAGGNGRITVTFDGKDQAFDLRPGDRRRGATFDRFGVFNLQRGGNHVVIYLDDLAYTAHR